MPPIKQRRTIQEFAGIANEAMIREMVTAGLNRIVGLVNAAVKAMNARVDARLAQLKDGYTPVKGKDYFDGKPGKDGYTPVKGKDYRDGIDGVSPTIDHQAIAQQVLPLVPVPKDGIAPTLEEIFTYLKERLNPEHFAGFEQYIIDTAKSKVRWEGGAAAVAVMQSGALKSNAAPALNYKVAGAPTVSIGANGVTNLDFPAAAGLTPLAATETPDGSTTVFTFSAATAQPSYLVVDNVWMKATSKAGSVNWTWNNATKKATLTIPAQDDIWAVV